MKDKVPLATFPRNLSSHSQGNARPCGNGAYVSLCGREGARVGERAKLLGEGDLTGVIRSLGKTAQ